MHYLCACVPYVEIVASRQIIAILSVRYPDNSLYSIFEFHIDRKYLVGRTTILRCSDQEMPAITAIAHTEAN